MIRLENTQISITLDSRSAGVGSITNKSTGETTAVDDAVFSIEVGTGDTPGNLGVFAPGNCDLKSNSVKDSHAEYIFEKDPIRITVSYRLEPGDCFALKQVRVDCVGAGRFNINRLDMLDWGLSPKPLRAIPYYGFGWRDGWDGVKDGDETPPSDNSTAFFLRGDQGGIFTALTCDYALMKDDQAKQRYRTTYWPGLILDAGTAFESEYAIVGVYTRKGLFHAPFEPKERLKEFRLPDVDARLDRGEMDAMMEAVEKLVKPGVYKAMVNAWAMGLPHLIEDENSLSKFRFAVDTMVKIPAMDALHFIHSWAGLSREFYRDGLGMSLQPNPYVQQAIQYAKDKGAGLSMFIGVSNNMPGSSAEELAVAKDQDLLSVNEQGQVRKKNIAISKRYADFTYDTVARLIDANPNIVGLTRDFLWVYADYATGHGYLPGRGSLYAQYANLRRLDQRLRERFPNLMLRGQMGYRDLGPWLVQYMTFVHNSVDPGISRQRNFVDFSASHQFANNLRLASWYANNCKMYPRHKMNDFVVHNGSSFRAWDYGAWEYCVLSRIAVGTGFGMLNNIPDEPNGEVFPPEEGAFLKKWMEWQKAHQDYYVREVELFGEPRPTGVDGYAYGNGKDSILFLCNPTFTTRAVSVPISQEVHLPANGSYTVKELYPEERYRIGLNDGVFKYGSTFVLNVPPQTVMVFEIRPDDPGNPLLLGIQGKLDVNAGGFRLSSVCGPTGHTRTFAIRLPEGFKGSQKVRTGDSDLTTVRNEGLLLGRVKFSGEAVKPEIAEWKAFRENGRLKVKASIHVPAVARTILEKQKLPVSREFDTPKWRNRTAWLGWYRFIISVPCVPAGLDPHRLVLNSPYYEQHRAVIESGTARLNGKTVPLQSNLMGKGNDARWSGYFIGATTTIRYGKVNEVEVDLPDTAEDGFYGLYMPNLTRQTTGSFSAVLPPSGLPIAEAQEAEDAFIAKPVVGREKGRVTLHLRLSISPADVSVKASDISVQGGRISGLSILGGDARWRTDEASKTRASTAVGAVPTRILMKVDGTTGTMLRLGDPTATCKFTLGDILSAWQARGDAFDPLATEFSWPGKNAKVVIELAGIPEDKLMVLDD